MTDLYRDMENIFIELDKSLNAIEMMRELEKRNQLPAHFTVIDVADKMREYYGPINEKV